MKENYYRHILPDHKATVPLVIIPIKLPKYVEQWASAQYHDGTPFTVSLEASRITGQYVYVHRCNKPHLN